MSTSNAELRSGAASQPNPTMSEFTTHSLEYYALPGVMTDPGDLAGLFDDLPTDIPALCQVVQGLLLHIFWAERYGVTLSDKRKQEVNIRQVTHMLSRIREMAAIPLKTPRSPEMRLVGNCRDFSVMLCAILRHQGVPARARCGFSTYFEPGRYEDHWVCEYWNADEERWVLVDAQLDDFQQDALNISFETCDLPRDQFLVGGKAWQICHAGQADPGSFGIFDLHGMWFVRGDLVRDFLALNKIEILPWDGWGLISQDEQALSADDMALLDHIATLTLAIATDDDAFPEIRALYKNDPRLHKPSDWPHE
ncbi:MAG: transglutaminase-like domain-containing protein [Chloroflexota bacterium]|nr:transglutaminase-like domain-containing protein [Chloroflexota bacterium]